MSKVDKQVSTVMSPPFPTTEYHIAGPPNVAFELAYVLSPVALDPHAIAIALTQSSFAGGYAQEPSSTVAFEL